MSKKIKLYIISILIPLFTGGFSALITHNNLNIYNEITIPPLTPPSFAFPIVWGFLYVFMGISFAIVFINRSTNSDNYVSAAFIYALQLIVNFFWSIIFFNMQAFLFAFVWLILLWILIIIMIFEFNKFSRIAAFLQIPYLLWVTFAGYLTFMVWILNGWQLTHLQHTPIFSVYYFIFLHFYHRYYFVYFNQSDNKNK